MVNKKLKKRGQQKGFAIVTTLIISSIVLVLVGSLFYKFSVNGKDLALDANRKTALSIAETASSGTLKYVSNKNNPTGKSDALRIELARAAASTFAIGDTTPDKDLTFPGYVRAQSGAKTGYAKFKSTTGEGEFEIKAKAVGGNSTTGSNNMEADIIAYVPAKAGAVVVRDFSLKFDRTFPPVPATGNVALPPAPPEPAAACETAKSAKATKNAAKDKKERAKATKSSAKKEWEKDKEDKSRKEAYESAKDKYATKDGKVKKATKDAKKSKPLVAKCDVCATQIATSVTSKATKSAAKSTAERYKNDNTKTAEQKASKDSKAKSAKKAYTTSVTAVANCTGLPVPTPAVAGFGVAVQSWTEVPAPTSGLLI